MPGRANQMAPENAYQMAPSRWTVPFKVLSNKRALDQAFQQHVWNMQRQQLMGQIDIQKETAQNAAGEGSISAIKPNYNILNQAVEMAKNRGIQIETPEGQQQFQDIYQALLYQHSGGKQGALMAAGGEGAIPEFSSTEIPNPVGPLNPMRISPRYADYGIRKGKGQQKLDRETGMKLLKKLGWDENLNDEEKNLVRQKARAMAKKLGYIF